MFNGICPGTGQRCRHIQSTEYMNTIHSRIQEYNSFMRANEDTKKREYRSMKDYEILFLAAAIILQIQLMMKR